MSQMSFFDAAYGSKRRRTQRDALLAQIEPVHPKAEDDRLPFAIETDATHPSNTAQEHRLGAIAAYALSDLWIARRWFAWAGELRLC
ncbi:hypothetical protein GCM10007862_21140 [Dyella lipolytica]|uniref:Uncharacterized protein n=1 Tax=Dyella lipolytica TaxID=1867835 RepID=A0ABW8IQV7_9GAMM|nr:hypothetical protein [Dyella lipolytica]GLQ47063.1 hypothetical protein GCM10007862_21140 [Dyella lipolytica]